MDKELTLGVLVYNQGPFVGSLIDSIANQTIKNTPLVIIDNSSTDNSCNEIENALLRHDFVKGVKFIRNINNSGSAAGLNQLLEHADTKYLAIIHGDDILSLNYVETIQSYASRNKSFAALNVTLKSFGNKDTTLLPRRFYTPLWTTNRIMNRILVCGLNPGVMPGSVLDRDFVLSRKLLKFDLPINGVEDTLLWMRIIRSGGSILSIQEPCYHYRIHESQFSYSDDRNSFYFGMARRITIQETSNLFERLLSSSEVAYEMRRFGARSRYVEGLGQEFLAHYKFFSIFRLFNIFARRIAKNLLIKRYR